MSDDKKTPEELQKELDAVQARLKEVNAESKDRRLQLEKHEAEKKALEDKNLSDSEKLLAQVKAVETQHESLKAELKAERVRTAILTKATELGFASPEDALSLTNLADIEVKDGKVSGFDKSLVALAESGRLAMKDAQRSDGLGTPQGRGRPASSDVGQAKPNIRV